ncbi:cell division protein FtsW [Rothia aeria]|uniref:Probable peptidoglycan glycosyltransferase FtsW n=1 Tax=Rothia aeria TaxID=172042 RepID=A0A2Z5QZI0_9MICC|nr:cell division protein FtsW [Rothia aeria]
MVLLYLGLIYCSVTIMVRTSDRFVRLAAGGITVWITAQALINMGMVTGVLPVIGVPLPFISYGGSSLLASMFAAGLLFAFSRQAPVYPLRRDPNRNLSPREIRRENEDWQRRLVLGQAVAEENRRMVQAGGALGLDVWHWRSQLRDAIHGLLVWLGLSSEQRARAHQRRVQQRELAVREAQKQQAAERERELLERQRLQQAQNSRLSGQNVQRPDGPVRQLRGNNGPQPRPAQLSSLRQLTGVGENGSGLSQNAPLQLFREAVRLALALLLSSGRVLHGPRPKAQRSKGRLVVRMRSVLLHAARRFRGVTVLRAKLSPRRRVRAVRSALVRSRRACVRCMGALRRMRRQSPVMVPGKPHGGQAQLRRASGAP